MGAIGLIDCTHIAIETHMRQIERAFINRKGVHSINVQAIVDHRDRFMNIVAAHPGATHDSFILRHSNVWTAFEDNERYGDENFGHLIGDSGYAQSKWMMTPIRAPANASHRRYNNAHASLRNGIERVFGQWKREFMQLKYVSRVALDRAPQIIVACAVLHNIRKKLNQI